jgi:hypothetical protein
MGNPLPKAGTLDFYTAYLVAGILAGGNDSGWQGPYTGATAVTVDPMLNAGVVTWKFTFSAAGTLTVTVTPSTTLMPGQRLRIVLQTGAYNVGLVMPGTFYFKRGIQPPIPQNSRFWVEFQYDETLVAWHETGRGAVPTTSPVSGGWQNLTLSSGWAALGGWQVPQYKIEDGFVRFRGVATTAAGVAANANIFTEPAGYLPAGNDVQGCCIYNGSAVAAGMVSFLTSGTSQTLVAVPAGGFIGLDGLRYAYDT